MVFGLLLFLSIEIYKFIGWNRAFLWINPKSPQMAIYGEHWGINTAFGWRSGTGCMKNTLKDAKSGIFPERSMGGAFGSRIRKEPSYTYYQGIMLSWQPLFLVAEP
jgi:hypothetical protein